MRRIRVHLLRIIPVQTTAFWTRSRILGVTTRYVRRARNVGEEGDRNSLRKLIVLHNHSVANDCSFWRSFFCPIDTPGEVSPVSLHATHGVFSEDQCAMPRIGRGYPSSSSSHEPTGNTTPRRSPDSGASGAAGRRERHGLLGLLRRSFRGSGSSTRESGESSAPPPQGHEPTPASQAAPRRAAALLQRSPVISRAHGEQVMARVAQASTEMPGRSTDATPLRSPARGTLSPQPEHRSARQTQAATIVEELRGAGVDLSHARSNISAATRGDPARFSIEALRVLYTHFPNLSSVGFDARDPLVAALRDRLRQETSGSCHLPA